MSKLAILCKFMEAKMCALELCIRVSSVVKVRVKVSLNYFVAVLVNSLQNKIQGEKG